MKTRINYTSGIWKANILGRPDEGNCEMSIVHEKNLHGFRSYGWDGEDKIILFYTVMPSFLWDLAIKFTEASAEALTRCFESNVSPYVEKDKGWEVIKASPFEVGLLKDGKGVRTWWSQDFNGNLPTLEHPIIQETINNHQE
jgi:hypothetical protein